MHLDAPSSPAARRAERRPAWRDPRLAVGVALVAVCVVLGSRLLASADDTVPVWSAATDLRAGAPLQPSDLRPTQVRFASSEVANGYLPATQPPPDGVVLASDVSRGSLLPRDAVTRADGPDLAELPVTVPAEAVPTGLTSGDLVDVWVTPEETTQRPEAVRLLDDARVIAVQGPGGGLGPAVTRQVLVGVPEDDEVLARALGGLASGTAVLVRQG